jgi:hypothetical protein
MRKTHFDSERCCKPIVIVRKAAFPISGAATQSCKGKWALSAPVLRDMEGGAGEFHSFPEIVRNYETSGTITNIVGRDGELVQMLKIPGSYGVYNGNFEFIKNANDEINHRFFRGF